MQKSEIANEWKRKRRGKWKGKERKGKPTHVYEIYMQISIDSGDMGDKRPALFMAFAGELCHSPQYSAPFSAPVRMPQTKLVLSMRVIIWKGLGQALLTSPSTWGGLSHQFELKTKKQNGFQWSKGMARSGERLQSCALDCEICRTIWLRRTELDRLGSSCQLGMYWARDASLKWCRLCFM